MDEFTISEIPDTLTLPDETEHQQMKGNDLCPTEQTCSKVAAEPQNDQICLTVQPDRIPCGVSAWHALHAEPKCEPFLRIFSC